MLMPLVFFSIEFLLTYLKKNQNFHEIISYKKIISKKSQIWLIIDHSSTQNHKENTKKKGRIKVDNFFFSFAFCWTLFVSFAAWHAFKILFSFFSKWIGTLWSMKGKSFVDLLILNLMWLNMTSLPSFLSSQ